MSDTGHQAPAAHFTAAARRRALLLRARLAEALAIVGILMVVAYCAYFLFDRPALLGYLRREAPGALVVPSDGQLWLAYGLSLIPAGAFVAAMWEARRFFALIGKAALFDRSIPRILVRLGGLAIFIAAAQIVVRTLVVLVMTSANPADTRQLVISASSNATPTGSSIRSSSGSSSGATTSSATARPSP